MTTNARFKKTVRARMAVTGETYTAARRAIQAEHAERLAACPCGCATRRSDDCTCDEDCACGPNCNHCDAELDAGLEEDNEDDWPESN